MYNGKIVNVRDCNFINNNARANGGALYIRGVKQCSMKTSTFNGNFAGLNGGGSYLRSITNTESLYFEMTKNDFKNNKAGLKGGGVVVKGEITGTCKSDIIEI